MIRPILRKDFELHWMAAIAVPALYVIANIVAIQYSNQQVVDVISIPLYAAGFYLLTSLVQGDPIPGDRSDWLIRPIRRGDLLLAKLIFVTIVFLLPMITIDLVVPFAMGFGTDRVPGAAVGHAISITFGLILPTMAIAAVTSNLAQSALGGILAAFAYSMMMPFLPWSVDRDVESFRWMEDVAVLAIAITTSIAILCLQYFGRRTRWSYSAGLIGFAAIAALAHVPLKHAWDLQAQLRPAIGFEEQVQMTPVESMFGLRRGSPLVVQAPISVNGRNNDYLMIPERATMRIRFSNGEVREAESRDLRAVNLVNGIHGLVFDFGVDAELYDLRDLLAEPEISLWFFAFKPYEAHKFDAENVAELLPDAGRCRAVRNKEAVIGECLQVGDDSPALNLSAGWTYENWLELSLDRLSPMFVRFGPTVFSWKSKLVGQKKIEVDPREPDKRDSIFKPFDAPVEIKTSALRGVVARKIRLQTTKFSTWAFTR